MKSAIKNEIIKLWLRKKIVVLLIISVGMMILSATLSYFDSNEVKMASNEIYEMEKQSLKSLYSNKEIDSTYIERSLEIIDTKMAHNIPAEGYQTGAMLLFEEITGGFFISIILPFAVIILCSDMIVGEQTTGSLKSLLFSPLGRGRLLFSKILAVFFVLLGLSIFYFLLEYITTGTLYRFGGWTDQIVLTLINPGIYSVWQGIVLGFLLLVISMTFYILLAIFFSVIFNNVMSSILGFITFVLIQYTSPLYMEKIPYLYYSVFPNVKLALFLEGGGATQPYGVSLISAIVVIGLAIVLLIYLSMVIFKKRDIFV